MSAVELLLVSGTEEVVLVALVELRDELSGLFEQRFIFGIHHAGQTSERHYE